MKKKKALMFTWMKIQGKQSGSSVALGLAKSHDSSSYFKPSRSICNENKPFQSIISIFKSPKRESFARHQSIGHKQTHAHTLTPFKWSIIKTPRSLIATKTGSSCWLNKLIRPRTGCSICAWKKADLEMQGRRRVNAHNALINSWMQVNNLNRFTN